MAVYLAAGAAGVLSHVLYFHRGEHHMWAPTYIQLFSVSLVGSIVALTKLSNWPLSAAITTTSATFGSFFFGAFASLLVYRIFLNPLNKFPGPWQGRITQMWMAMHTKNMDLYLKNEALHKKYGKYVRVGPNVLSISDPDVYDAAFGKHVWAKAEWYDGSKPFDSMHTVRDKAIHDRRRRIWAPAFSDKALREYETKVKSYNDKLVERLRQFGGGTVNASKWFNLYSFDVMGQLAFGKDYKMMDTGELHWALILLNEGMEAVPERMPVWLFRVLLAIPFAAGGLFKFLKFCRDELEWRVNNKVEGGDITGWLLKGYGSLNTGYNNPADDPMFQGDSRLIIVAGSDTTAATMTFLFYHLANKPEEIKKLRDELKPLTSSKDWSDVDIKNAPRLNGALNESLRLHPPVPSGVERLVPKGGATVGEVVLPEGTQFWMPQYVIGRDEDNYERALDFVPERWFSKPEMIKHKNAFAPFSLGSEGCIGKNLAYMEMRTLTAQLLLNFDVSLAPGEDGHRLLYKSRDHFTTGLGQVDLIFTPLSG
ncbi:uncharacterized protein LTR77_005280 [Saxophila tyrrhenica]|uniref:Cytochrome P450 monooxygenase n=1 Tax=Saxophila tyrrhenica TaxID=1690608 RepID=A0AAV9PEQ3_9PEZI|nr:hypothetical protein LTR77_005280 [Saxophila tyrrhenica]